MAMATLDRVACAEETGYMQDVSARPVIPATPASQHPQPRMRRLIRNIYRLLPLRGQRLALRLGAPKVTMGVCAVIEDAAGRILLAHHTYRRLPWGLPGGLIDRGERKLAKEFLRVLDRRRGFAHRHPPLHAGGGRA